MNIRLKPKSYGPLAVGSEEDGAIFSTSEGGHSIPVGLMPAASASSPSDLLLAALGSCIAISTGMAADALGLTIGKVSVQVDAAKAEDLPHRIKSFNVVVRFAIDGQAEDIDRILHKTKELCTISNTLAAEIGLRYQSP